MSETKYVRCGSHCKHEAYTKAEVDAIVSGFNFVPIGALTQYAGSTAPTGWLVCDGSAVSRTTYSDLFTVIGTTYGTGDGSTTFNLPNLKGKVPVGYDSGDTLFDSLGETGGAKTHTLTINEMPSHSHTIYERGVYAGNGDWDADIHFSTPVTTPKQISSTGGDQAHNNLQPYIVMNYIIKYEN